MFPGPPPAELVARNRLIMHHTLLRRQELIARDGYLGDSHLGKLEDDESGRAAVISFLKVFIGDFASERPIHFCGGCHHDPTEVSEHMYAACCSVDLLVAKGSQPSLDDWGTAGQAVGKIAAGPAGALAAPTCLYRCASILERNDAVGS